MYSTVSIVPDLEPPLTDPAFTSFWGDRADFRLAGTVSVPISG
ncbi:hypothetical protein [Conyzicola sp.]